MSSTARVMPSASVRSVSPVFSSLAANPPMYQQPTQPQANYAQPGAYRAPAPATSGTQSYRYPQAATGSQQRQANVGTWPNYAQPQAPNYQMAPLAKSGSIAPTASIGEKTTTSSSTRKPVFSTTNKTSTAAATSREKEPDPMPYVAPKEARARPRRSPRSPLPDSLSTNEPDPLPKQSFSDSSSSASSKVTSVAVASQSPLRAKPQVACISPYPPNKELDVKGCPAVRSRLIRRHRRSSRRRDQIRSPSPSPSSSRAAGTYQR